MKKFIYLLAGLTFILSGCSSNDDDAPNPISFNVETELAAENFIWSAMNYWYFWQEEVPDLANNRFNNAQQYAEFISGFSSPNDLFYNLCNRHSNIVGNNNPIDRFSFVSDDYNRLLNSQQGNFKSNGVEFGLVRFSNNNNIYGYVRYIIPGSDAVTKNIQRGDIFTGVDGQTLNLNNYVDLLFGDNDSYTLNMADIENNVITPNGQEVTLTKTELTENPVLISKTLDVGGTKVGYVMYNAFTGNFDDQLNEAFGQLKSEGVTELVLDLRYNGGGSVASAVALSSMITGQFTGDLFSKQTWNPRITATFTDSQLEDRFVSSTRNGQSINSLNLTKVYIIGLGSTASASELVINGLDPYINVVHVGATTRGKNEFSLTLLDKPNADFPFFSEEPVGLNPNHTYAIQPLVGRNENSIGNSDYTSGLVPDINLDEDLANLGTLGDENEPLLARALQEIGAVGRGMVTEPQIPIKEVTNSKMFLPTRDNMYVELD
ncbi:S41 family peptidase [Ascidiimonas sp. W6]|uniref:S41 family peptidase n=1 Tax=Ascidiimonas meishanensis TaxID=3128903 RepID=UPI0030EC2A60